MFDRGSLNKTHAVRTVSLFSRRGTRVWGTRFRFHETFVIRRQLSSVDHYVRSAITVDEFGAMKNGDHLHFRGVIVAAQEKWYSPARKEEQKDRMSYCRAIHSTHGRRSCQQAYVIRVPNIDYKKRHKLASKC